MEIPAKTPHTDATAFHYDPGPDWQFRYWAVFAGQAVSLIGSALTQFVLLWWITDTTGSVSALATAGVAALLPQAILGPWAGIVADRYNRRKIMIIADLVSAASMGVIILLFLTESVELWHLYGMMALRSAMQGFQQPAASASIAMLVPLSFLPRAAGLNQTMVGIMSVAAPPLGVLALSLMPMGWALTIDLATALLGILPLLMYSIPQAKNDVAADASFLADFREGLSTVWNHRGLFHLYVIMSAFLLTLTPTFTLIPLLVKEHFLGKAPEVAFIEGVGGVGMIIGGFVVSIVTPRRQVRWILLGFAASSLGLGLMAFSPSNMLLLAAVCWAISGFAYILGNAPLMALLQSTVPNRLQGRVLSLLSTIMGIAAPLGLAIAIPLGKEIGIKSLFVVLGVVGCLVALSGFLSPTLRAMDAER